MGTNTAMKTLLRTDPSVFEDDEEIIYPDVETLKEMFKYELRPNDTHREILKQMEIYIRDNEKWMQKRNKYAGRRARVALLKIYHLVRARRIEILSVWNRPDFRDPDFRM